MDAIKRFLDKLIFKIRSWLGFLADFGCDRVIRPMILLAFALTFALTLRLQLPLSFSLLLPQGALRDPNGFQGSESLGYC